MGMYSLLTLTNINGIVLISICFISASGHGHDGLSGLITILGAVLCLCSLNLNGESTATLSLGSEMIVSLSSLPGFYCRVSTLVKSTSGVKASC